MKKTFLLIGCLISLSLAAENPAIQAHVCQVDNFLAGCTVFPRAEGDQAGVPVDVGGTTYDLYLSWGTPAEFAYTDSVKEGGVYLFGCDAVTLDGKTDSTFTRVEQTASGCDSIIKLTLKEYIPCQDVTFAYTDSVAVGGIYLFGCAAVTLDGKTDSTFTRVEQTASGCDSIITLTLTAYKPIVLDTLFKEVKDSVCDQEVYPTRLGLVTVIGREAIYDSIFSDTIAHADTLITDSTIVIVDSIYKYSLKVWPKVVVKDTLRDTVLVDSLPYKWTVYDDHKISCDTAGIYHDTLDNDLGCDSIIYSLSLKVIGHDTIEVIVPDSNLCDGDVYKSRWQELTMVGREAIFDTTFNDTVIVPIVEPFTEDTIHDTIYMYHLYVWPKVVVMPTKYDTALVDTLPYHWNTYTGKTIECYTADTYRDTAKNILDCDSIRYTLELAVIAHDTVTLPVEANLCLGESYTSRLQNDVTPYSVGDTSFNDTVPSIMMEPLLMRDSIYAYTLHVQSRYLDSLPALVKDDSWLLMIHRRSIVEDYGINFSADQVHWYKVVGEVDEYPYGEDNDTKVGTGDYYTVASKMSGQYYALIDVDVTWKASCALYARTVILDCDNPQPVGPVLSPTYVAPGGLMRLTNLAQGETQLNVFTPAGQLIRTERVLNETEHELRAEGVCGFYLLQVNNDGQKYVFKYVVTQ